MQKVLDKELLRRIEEEYDEYDQNIIKAIARTHEISLEEAIDKFDDVNVLILGYNATSSPELSLAYSVVDEVFGGLDNMDRETLERHFDFESYGRDLSFEYTIDEETGIAISNY